MSRIVIGTRGLGCHKVTELGVAVRFVPGGLRRLQVLGSGVEDGAK